MQASVGYTEEANTYEKGRPDYPKEAISFLINELGINAQTTVVDVGAGVLSRERQLIVCRNWQVHAAAAAHERAIGAGRARGVDARAGGEGHERRFSPRSRGDSGRNRGKAAAGRLLRRRRGRCAGVPLVRRVQSAR